MKPIALALTSILSLSVGAGCVVRATGGVSTYAYAEEDPALVEVSPGVYVIEDYGEPVFYSGGAYWLYRDNVWYRSRYYDRGWVYVDSYRVPGHFRRMDPYRYRRYHSSGPVYRRHNGRVVRSERRARDNRGYDRRGRDDRRDDRRRPDVTDQRRRDDRRNDRRNDRRHY